MDRIIAEHFDNAVSIRKYLAFTDVPPPLTMKYHSLRFANMTVYSGKQDVSILINNQFEGRRVILGNHHKREVSHYRNGIKNGLTIIYDHLGKVKIYLPYVDGVPEGYEIVYDNGEVVSYGLYHQGLKTGYWIDEFKLSFQDVVIAEGKYELGQKVGDWILHFPKSPIVD